MTPLYFGERSRRLFGLYSPAHATGGRARGAVLCAPWGAEYLRAHRSMAQLGKWLSEAGVHVLRFDYFGTGDSAGDMTDARLDGWVKDVQDAIDELKDTAGLQKVTLIGLRLGATLAVRAAAQRRRDVDGLVLWDPVESGPVHLGELRALHAQALSTRGLSGSASELLGFAVSDALLDDIAALNLLSPAPSWPSRTLAVVSAGSGSHAALAASLQAAGVPAPDSIDVQPAWLEDRHSGAGAVPVKLLHRIVDWVKT